MLKSYCRGELILSFCKHKSTFQNNNLHHSVVCHLIKLINTRKEILKLFIENDLLSCEKQIIECLTPISVQSLWGKKWKTYINYYTYFLFILIQDLHC